MGNCAVVSRATARPRPGRAVVRGRATRQRKNRAIKSRVNMVIRVRKLHVRKRTGKPMEISKTIKDKTGKPMKRIKMASNNRIGKPIRRKRDIKVPRISNLMGPSKAVLTEKNSS